MATLVTLIKGQGVCSVALCAADPVKRAVTWMVKENSVECLQENTNLVVRVVECL